MDIVDKMIDYRKNRESIVFGDLPTVNPDSLTVIVTEILSWLKLERRRELWIEQGKKIKHKPMELNMSYPWCKDLEKILMADNPFSEVFCINDNRLNFKQDVSMNFIHEILEEVDEKYQPQMVIS